MKRILFLALIIFIMFEVNISHALNVESHMAINDYIAHNNMNGFSLDTFLTNTLGFSSGINEKFNTYYAWEWLRIGGKYEDDPPGESPPYRRSRNHFHNPLLPWNQAYYTDWFAFCTATDNPPFFVSGHCPISAILWAQGPQTPIL